ncbi:hypothetical protein BJX99DRAFT_105715 [Aspergillus californicus]
MGIIIDLLFSGLRILSRRLLLVDKRAPLSSFPLLLQGPRVLFLPCLYLTASQPAAPKPLFRSLYYLITQVVCSVTYPFAAWTQGCWLGSSPTEIFLDRHSLFNAPENRLGSCSIPGMGNSFRKRKQEEKSFRTVCAMSVHL